MKKRISIAVLVVVLSGCIAKEPTIPQGKFLLHVNTLVDDDTIIVKNLEITAKGPCVVEVREKGGRDQSRIDVDSETNLSRAEVILMADMISFSSQQNAFVTWLVRIKHNGGHVGGASRMSVPHETKLPEYIDLTIKTGEYEFERDIELGTLDGKPIALRVK